MNLDRPASLEDRWLDVFRELGEPEALLACTFTFRADFFADLLDRFAEACCEGGAGPDRPFGNIPIDVVCDSSRYNGHHLGFNVTLWPKTSRLFHSKLLIALFGDEVVWSDGSLNLTPAGWHRNREIAMLHRPRHRALPRELRGLIEAFPKVAAAGRIVEATKNETQGGLPGRFLTSLHEPIGARFISGAPRHADEVHLVAPFFEKSDSAEAPLDDGWLHLLARRYPNAVFHVYLPQLASEPLRVQGCRAMFETLEGRLSRRIALHPVAPDPGPLHGKAVCLVHTMRDAQRACILVGSPNMTNAALIAPVSSCNIESAWILDEPWRDAKKIFLGLGSKAWTIDDAEFEPPQITRLDAWMPLRRASYDPLRREVRLEWKKPADVDRTIIRHAGRRLSFERALIPDFDLVDNVGWLETRKRGGGAVPGCCPIEVPVELLPACGADRERTPEEWLEMLGSVSADGFERGVFGLGKGLFHDRSASDKFVWSVRVRDLASKMTYLMAALNDASTNSVEREWRLKHFFKIYDSHEPATASTDQERVWRVWVRLELWRVAECLSSTLASKKARALWRGHAQRLRRRLCPPALAPAIRKQIQVVVKALVGPV